MLSALCDFHAVIQTLHERFIVIAEFTVTIDSQDPTISPQPLPPRNCTAFLDTCKAFTKCSDKLANFAAGQSDFHAVLVGDPTKQTLNAIQVASELGVADILGNREFPLYEIARANAGECLYTRTRIITWFTVSCSFTSTLGQLVHLLVNHSKAAMDPMSLPITTCHATFVDAREKLDRLFRPILRPNAT